MSDLDQSGDCAPVLFHPPYNMSINPCRLLKALALPSGSGTAEQGMAKNSYQVFAALGGMGMPDFRANESNSTRDSNSP